MADPLPDWRAEGYEGWYAADWPWAFRYIPRYANLTPNHGNPLHYIDDASPRWTSGTYSLSANRPSSYILLGADIYMARWWMSPEDTGGLAPDDGLTRVGVGVHIDGGDPIAFYVRNWGGDVGGMGAWRCIPRTYLGWNAIMGTMWNTNWYAALPVGIPTWSPQEVGYVSWIGPTRRIRDGQLIQFTETPWTSLDLSYLPL